MAEITTLEDLTATPHASPFSGTEPKVVRLALESGERIEPHRHPERQIVLYVLSGRIELQLGDETHELDSNDLARFDGRQDISPEALEASEALLVLAKRADS